MTIEYSWLGPNWNKETIRGQIHASNIVIRYNVLKEWVPKRSAQRGMHCRHWHVGRRPGRFRRQSDLWQCNLEDGQRLGQ